jgi:hypothetical protein
MAQGLIKRLKDHPNAKTLKELFPDQKIPARDDFVYRSRDKIGPSWARLRKTLVTHLREQGTNTLLASLVSGDLTNIPKSKLFYACVSSQEIWNTMDDFYRKAGWGQAVEMPSDILSFGCQVVPTWQTLQEIDENFQARTAQAHPGKNSSIGSLLLHHNAFITWAGSRLVVLLALRESKAIDIQASIHELQDRWVLINDKEVTGSLGAMPQAVTQQCALIMSAIRAHCAALHRRLSHLGVGHSELARWAKQVCQHGSVPFLCLARSEKHINPLSTADILASLPSTITVAPDWGRKFMENQLRHEGLHSSEVDAFLRHTVPGQVRMCSISVSHPSTHWWRINRAVTTLTHKLWSTLIHGLAKE